MNPSAPSTFYTCQEIGNHELTITVSPILLGEGRPLFGPLPADVNLAHVATRAYEFGFAQHKYRVQVDA